VGFDLSGEPYFKEVSQTRQPYFSDTFFSLSTNDIAVTVAHPILHGGTLAGVLVGELSLDDLQQTIQTISFGKSDLIFILDERGTVIAHPERALVRQQVNLGNISVIQRGYAGPAIEILLMGSEWSIASAMPMQNGWLVVTSRPIYAAARPLIILIGVSLAAFLASIVILIVAVQRSVRRISNPIAHLAERTEAISTGQYTPLDDEVTSGRFRELNALGHSFNRMVATVEARTSELLAANAKLQVELEERQRIETALRKSEERYKLLFEGTPVALLEEDFSEVKQLLDQYKEKYQGDWQACLSQNPDLPYECARLVKILSVNRASYRMHRSDPEGDSAEGLMKIFQALVPSSFALELEAIWFGRTTLELESQRDLSDAPVSFAIVKWTALEDYKKPYDRVLISIIDVTPLKLAEKELTQHREHLEELVRERTTELERANQELESFAYTVSHDLRTPLRHIDAYSSLLLMDYGGQLDEQGREFLGNVRKGSQNMGRMVDGLLQLSRAAHGDLHQALVDLSVLADEISRELAAAEPGRQVGWVIAPDCRAQGDVRLLRAALQNLLGNAWKFTQTQPQARIEFGRLPEAEAQARYAISQAVFFVRDNGAGFDMKFAGKLFTPFQRLHSDEQFAGTGIGLATVQRIIRRHGGDIWAESGPGRGAAFYFTLP
jgi:signal transduction histidine kinase